MGKTILTRGISVLDWTELGRKAGALRPESVAGLADLMRRVRTDDIAAVIVGSGFIGDIPIVELADLLSRRRVPLIFRLDLQPLAIRRLISLQHRGLDLYPSLIGFDKIEHALNDVTGGYSIGPIRDAIIAKMLAGGRNVPDIMIGAAVVGSQAASVQSLAAVVGSSTRTIDERLAKEKIMPAKRILMRIQMLYAAWQLQRLGWNPKRVAEEAGFASVEALSRRIERTVGRRLSALSEGPSIDDELTRFANDIVRDRACPTL